jgi:hypothetical protein
VAKAMEEGVLEEKKTEKRFDQTKKKEKQQTQISSGPRFGESST